MQRSQRSATGFTVIEIMIVLAIGGLILLIVLLAVPALQRNSRQNAQRSDIARILAGVAEFRTHNNNTLPPTPQADAGSGDEAIIGGPGGVCSAGLYCVTAKLSFYDAANISFATTVPTPFTDENTAVILIGYSCNNNTPVAAAPGVIAAYYVLENGQTQCKAS